MIKKKSSQKEKKETLEHLYLTTFLNLLNLNPNQLRRGDEQGEKPPDFVMVLDGKTIGVEVTRYHQNSRRKEYEGEWEKLKEVIEQERSLYPGLNEVSASLDFNFKESLEVPPKGQHRKFAQELCKFILDELNHLSSEQQRFTSFQSSSLPLLNQYLGSLRLKVQNVKVTWRSNHNSGSVRVHECELQSCVQKKASGVSRWNPLNPDEKWLLIVSGHRISQAMDPLYLVDKLRDFRGLNCDLKNSSFDKVYIFQIMRKKILLWQSSTDWIEVEYNTKENTNFSLDSLNSVIERLCKK